MTAKEGIIKISKHDTVPRRLLRWLFSLAFPRCGYIYCFPISFSSRHTLRSYSTSLYGKNSFNAWLSPYRSATWLPFSAFFLSIRLFATLSKAYIPFCYSISSLPTLVGSRIQRIQSSREGDEYTIIPPCIQSLTVRILFALQLIHSHSIFLSL